MKLAPLLLTSACTGLSGGGADKNTHSSTDGDTSSEHSDPGGGDSDMDDTGGRGSDSEVRETGGTGDSSDTDSPETGDTGPEDTIWDLDDADAKMIGELEMDNAGDVVAAMGDNNGDGLADSAVLAYSDPGTVYIVNSPVVSRYDLGESDGKLSCDGIDGVGLSTYLAPMAGGGDVNADGYADLLIGMPFSGDDDEGWTWLAMGPIEGESDLLDMDATIVGSDPGDGAGSSVAWLTDTNGDGWDDLAIGAAGVNGDESSLGECAGSDEDAHGDEEGVGAGAAFVFLGPISGVLSLDSASARITGEDGGDTAGAAIVGDHDLDGDGVLDLVIGADNNCEGGMDAGAAYVVLGPVSGDLALADADAKRTGNRRDDEAGAPLAVAGDVNGDGYPDLLIGAPDSDSRRGTVYLELGPLSGSQRLAYADATFTGENTSDRAGISLTGADDQNLDGYDDILIGAPYADTAYSTYGGAAYLLFGPLTGAHDLSDADARLSERDNSAGISVANLGDTDGDGLSDLLIGASRDSEAAPGSGAAYLLLGGGPLLTHAIGEE